MSKKKDELIKFANDPEMLPGVYNYCDRWCERCLFTSRCTVFTTEKEETAESSDNVEEFLQSVQDNFEIALELLHDLAEEEGIDLTDIDFEQIEAEQTELREKIDNHPLSKSSMNYILEIDKWFKTNQELFEDYSQQMENELELELPDKIFANNAIKINDAIEMIQWYQAFIHVKLKRSLLHTFDANNRNEFTEEDSNISAKLALIAIDRSMAGWNVLFNNFSEEQDTIIDWLLMLDKLRKQTVLVFPDAEKTKRPYFDE